ncbi:MAG: hypothetical protein R3C52_16030 [Hyphomonadaceae bacterium]
MFDMVIGLRDTLLAVTLGMAGLEPAQDTQEPGPHLSAPVEEDGEPSAHAKPASAPACAETIRVRRSAVNLGRSLLGAARVAGRSGCTY